MNIFHKRDGFTLIEVMVGVAIFLIFATGIYSGTQFVFKVVYQSRLRIIETSILNEQVEVIRNLAFADVGIVNGSPSGLLERTVTTTRNGIEFLITRTVRNIDDPFDGTIGGQPNDLSPADYKLVDLDVICTACGQREPVSLSTRVAPKYLEGDPTNGALFIEVFDASAVPVQGASVHIVATTTDPTVDFVDVTNNAGRLNIVDLGAGVQAYDITVTKNGYTTDMTRAVSQTIVNPVKPLASVIAQDVTSISFSIDLSSSLSITTQDAQCAAIGSVPMTVLGTKLIATEPDVFLVNADVTSNGSGVYNMTDLVWDAYGIQVSGYDLIGSIPGIPVSLPPGTGQPVQLLLGTDTAHSLLVHVQDSVTGQPLSSSTVRVFTTSTPYDETKTTGLGHIRQTDWSGGAGQTMMSDLTRYAADDGNVDVTTSSGDVYLRLVGNQYVASGFLESSIFDLGVGATYINLLWEPFSQPAQTGDDSLRFQIATSNTSTPGSWDYLGPDGTAGTYYNDMNTAINPLHNGDQYFRYKAYMQTASTTYSPSLSEVWLPYTNSCTPPGQVFFEDISNVEYTVEVGRPGYQTSTETVTVDGDIIFAVDLVAS